MPKQHFSLRKGKQFMNRKILWAVFLMTALGLSNTPSLANQPPLEGGDFKILRATLDAGGGVSSGGEFVLRGTSGQPDAGRSDAGEIGLRSGFWTTRGPIEDRLFRDRFEVIVPRLGQFTP